MAETVHFNVGGTKYEVARSLIQRYPNTMLARMISEEWQNSNGSNTNELFIERDGDRFRYVLDYLRDGKIILPITIPKSSLMEELKYYGIENVNENSLNESAANVFQMGQTMRKLTTEQQELNKVMESLFRQYRVARAASMCAQNFKQHVQNNPGGKCYFSQKSENVTFGGIYSQDLEDVNVHLKRFGLKATKVVGKYLHFQTLHCPESSETFVCISS